MLVFERRHREVSILTVPPSDQSTVIRIIVSDFTECGRTAPVKNNRGVRLAFDAPRAVTIMRSEVQDRIDAAKCDGIQVRSIDDIGRR